MDHIKAINKLIQRNRNLVLKSGVTEYTRETDKIINALLTYVHQSSATTHRANHENQSIDAVFTLFDIPDEFRTMDPEFLHRYINYKVVPEMWFNLQQDPDTYRHDAHSILTAWRNVCKYVNSEFEIFNTVRSIFNHSPDMIKNNFPEYYSWIKNALTDDQIKQELKRKVYYYYE